jgi:hypothetical protein
MNGIVIKKGLKIGELDAEADESLLETCFVDNGQLKPLLDVNSPASIVLGRTGAGKSALLYKISKEVEHSSSLDPNYISIRFLEHSNIIQFFNEIGVKLDLFYRILWRHILTVELLKLRYELKSEKQSKSLLEMINGWVQKDPIKEKALSYFTEWGDKFWLETDEQLRELTSKFTSDVKKKLGTKYQGVEISLEGAKSLSEEVKTEIRSLATQVVSSLQIKRLTEVLELLSEHAFNDRQRRFYVLIDKLDEDWAETETRCRFIRALVEETKSMRKIPQVKIVTALRVDLLDLVFDKTRDSGFQEEKYDAYIIRLIWSTNDLKKLLNTRVTEVFRRQYTSNNVQFDEVFPLPDRSGITSIDYMLDRTLMRPRDAIQFANECFSLASDKPSISWTTIRSAESNYSVRRLKSLIEEWSEYYPSLDITIEILRGILIPFTRSNLQGQKIDNVSLELTSGDMKDPCVIVAKEMYEAHSHYNESDLIVQIIICLYHVGAIGLKISTLDPFVWSYQDQPKVTKSEVKRSNQIMVHKMFLHALEVNEKSIISMPSNVKPHNQKKKKRR